MWQSIIQMFPESSLNSWLNALTVSAILLPILGGMCGFLAWGVGNRMSANKELNDLERSRRLEIAEHNLKSTQEKLSTAEEELIKLRPKPLKDRIIIYLQKLDTRIIQAAKDGQREFRGTFTTSQLADLQSLCDEDTNGTYISIIPTTNTIIPGPGQHGGIAFRITDRLIGQGVKSSVDLPVKMGSGLDQ